MRTRESSLVAEGDVPIAARKLLVATSATSSNETDCTVDSLILPNWAGLSQEANKCSIIFEAVLSYLLFISDIGWRKMRKKNTEHSEKQIQNSWHNNNRNKTKREAVASDQQLTGGSSLRSGFKAVAPPRYIKESSYLCNSPCLVCRASYAFLSKNTCECEVKYLFHILLEFNDTCKGNSPFHILAPTMFSRV